MLGTSKPATSIQS